MDPPPPFHHQNRPNFRYGNPIHSPNFIPSHFLSPPSQPNFRSPLFPPPPPPPPPRHMAHHSIPHNLTSQHPFILERSHQFEFHPPPKPYSDCTVLPPPPMRLPHDYRERNPMSSVNFIERLPENLRVRVSDLGSHERYDNIVYRGHELYSERDDDEMRWGNDISNRENELYKEMDHGERRWDYGISDRGCDFYNERDDGHRMLGYGINDWDCQLQSKRDDDQREHGYCIDELYHESRGYNLNDRRSELNNESDIDQRRWGHGINDRGRELYSESDDQKRWGYGKDEYLLQVENRQQEFSGKGLCRLSGRLGKRVNNEDFGTYKKRRKVPKMSALDRIQLGKPLRRRNGSHSHQHVSKVSSSGSFRGQEKESLKKLETRMENVKEREQSPIELAISFKSNALVAKTILAPPSPDAKSDVDFTPRDKNGWKVNSIHGSPLATSSKDIVTIDLLTCGLDIQSDVKISEELLEKSSVSGMKTDSTDNSNDLDEIAAEDKPLIDMKMQGFNNVESGQTHVRRRKWRAKKQLLHKINLQSTNDCGETIDCKINASSSAPLLNSSTALPKTDEVPVTELALTGSTLSKIVDVEGVTEELSVSGKKISTVDGTNDLDEIAAADKPLEDMKMQGFNNVGSGQTRALKRKEKRAKKQLLHKINLQTTNDCGKTIGYDINASSAAPPLNSITALPKTDEVPVTELALTGGTLSKTVDVEGGSKELSVSGKKSATADGTNYLDEIAVADKPLEDMKTQGFDNVGSGQTRALKKKRRRARKQLLHKINLQTTNDCGKTIDYDINASSAAPPLNSNAALPKTDEVPDTELVLTGGTLSKIDDVGGVSEELSVSGKKSATADGTNGLDEIAAEDKPLEDMKMQGFNNVESGQTRALKRKMRRARKRLLHKINLQTTNDCGKTIDYDINASSAAPPLNSNTAPPKTDEVPDTKLALTGGTHSKIVDAEGVSKELFVSGKKSATVDGTNDFDGIAAEDKPLEDMEMQGFNNVGSGLTRVCRKRTKRAKKQLLHEINLQTTNDCGNHEFIVDKYSLETHESCSAAETNCLYHVKPEDIADSGLGFTDVNLKEFSRNQVNITQVGVNAVGMRSSASVTVADCLNVNSGIATNSNFVSVDHKGTSDESNFSFLDNMSQQSCDDGANFSHIIGSVEGSVEAINNVKTCSSIDQSSKVMMERKAGDVQMGLSGPKINEHLDTVGSVNGEVVEVSAKNSAAAVDFPCEGDSCEENESLGVDGSFSGLRKKRRVISSRLGSVSPRLHETEDGQTEVNHSAASTATNNCGTTDVDINVCRDKFFVLGMDKTLAYDNKLHVEDDMTFNLSSCSDGEVYGVADSGDVLISSDSDVPSCPSSPEDLLLFPDFCFPENSGASPSQSSSGNICGTDKTVNERPVSADPNTLLGKPLEKADSNDAQSVPKFPLLVPKGTYDVQKLSTVIGKSTFNKKHLTAAVPKVFPLYPSNSNMLKKFPSAQCTKSRTWSRTGSASVAVTGPKLQPSALPQSHAKMATINQSSYIRKGNSLVRKPSPSSVIPPPSHALSSSVYRLDPCIYNLKKSQATTSRVDGVDAPTPQGIKRVNTFERPKAPPINHSGKLLNSNTCNLRESLSVTKSSKNGCPKYLDSLDETAKSCAIAECKNGSGNNSDSGSTLDEGNSRKRITYVKRKSNQLVAAPGFEDTSMSGVCNTQTSLSDGYYKSRQNQLVRASVENHAIKGDAMVNLNSSRLGSQALPPKSSSKRQSGKGSSKAYRSSKFSHVWRLHNSQSPEKHNNSQRPHKVWSYLSPLKRATYRRNFVLALGSKSNSNFFSSNSQKLLLAKKRGAVYTRSKHGYSLKMSKLLSVGGSSLKWSKSIERTSKKANEEATRAVVAAEKRKKEEKIAVPIVSKSRNSLSRKLVLSIKLRPGERIFRIGSDRYKMDPTRRTLQRITEEPSASGVLQPEKNVKRSYVPKRLFIDNNEYVRIGNGNQLVRDPKKRTRSLANEKVRWSLRTARMRLAKKRKYCQFFTRYGKCNKDDGKCPYIHDPSKIVVCTKFLNGSCSNSDCKLTHKVIPERMEDCSYFLKGSCSNENCPYRHVNVNPDASVCECFLRGYCADGNECRKKHTYACPAFEATGICPLGSTCKLHHPKKKTEKKPTAEEKIVRGRYFDGGLITVDDSESEKLSQKGKDDIVFEEGKYPDYISLDISDDEVEHTMAP